MEPGYISQMLRSLRSSPGMPFILAFIILLVLAAIYLALGMENQANKLAEYAYYMLVVGVILELFIVIRSGDEEKTNA